MTKIKNISFFLLLLCALAVPSYGQPLITSAQLYSYQPLTEQEVKGVVAELIQKIGIKSGQLDATQVPLEDFAEGTAAMLALQQLQKIYAVYYPHLFPLNLRHSIEGFSITLLSRFWIKTDYDTRQIALLREKIMDAPRERLALDLKEKVRREVRKQELSLWKRVKLFVVEHDLEAAQYRHNKDMSKIFQSMHGNFIGLYVQRREYFFKEFQKFQEAFGLQGFEDYDTLVGTLRARFEVLLASGCGKSLE